MSGATAKQLNLETQEGAENSIDRIKKTHTPELIIGLCGPIGSRIHTTAKILEKVLRNDYEYNVQPIKLSDFIRSEINQSFTQGGYEEKMALIDKGNEMRAHYGDDVLAKLAINQISGEREEAKGRNETRYVGRRICHIIDSIKNEQELRTLETVYGDLFYCFGIFSPKSQRVENLEKKMASSEVFKLIDRDSGEEIHNGQSVEDTFPLADFFIRDDERRDKSIETKIKRALSLIFEDDIVTPTKDEFAMYHAASAASNSACMSRQVGACITNNSGEILSIGWNEAPKAFGGVYSGCALSEDSSRCFQISGGECTNKKWRDFLSQEIIQRLVEEKLVLPGREDNILRSLAKTRLDSLLEFSRSIHAEMNAIILGAQKTGNKMVGGKLYCTTFPCHNCARHIVVAGITEVFYIEPYQKSLALDLHGDSITEDVSNKEKVRVCLFDGVAPARYMDFFTNRRKWKTDTGVKKEYPSKETSPSKTLSLESIPALEALVVEEVVKKEILKKE